MTEKLRLCPHCEGTAEVCKKENYFNELEVYVVCQVCCATTAVFNSADEAAKAWNMRAAVTLQEWKPGSNPPDGWYRVMPIVAVPERVAIVMYLHDKALHCAIPCGFAKYCDARDYTLHGPIPGLEEGEDE